MHRASSLNEDRVSILCRLRDDLLTEASNEGKESERKVQAEHFLTVLLLYGGAT